METRSLGRLENLERQINGRQKLAFIQRVAIEKSMVKQIGHMEKLAFTEMHFNDHLKKHLKEDLFHIHIHTKSVNDQRQVVDRFMDKIEEEQNNDGFEAQTEQMVNTAPAQLNNNEKNGESPLAFGRAVKSGDVALSYGEKRLRVILPQLVKHREQVLKTTLLKTDDKLPPLVPKKKPRQEKHPSAKAMVVVHSKETNRIQTPITPTIAVTSDEKTEPAKQPKIGDKTKSDADRNKVSTNSRSDVRTSTVTKGTAREKSVNVFDTIHAEMDEEERHRIDRLNMLRLMAGMTGIPPPAGGANWNKEMRYNNPANPNAERHQPRPIRTAESPGCPDLRDPLPCNLPKLKLKKKERARLTRPLPLASRLLFGRFRITCKKIEDTYLSSWKERVLSEDKWRLIDLRRKQEAEKLLPKDKDKEIEAKLLAQQQQRGAAAKLWTSSQGSHDEGDVTNGESQLVPPIHDDAQDATENEEAIGENKEQS